MSGRAAASSRSTRPASRMSQSTCCIALDGGGVARAAVGGQRRLVACRAREMRSGRKPSRNVVERAADRAGAAGDEHAPAAEELLQLEHRRHRVAPLQHASASRSRRAAGGARRCVPGRHGDDERALDRAVAGLHVRRARRIRLVDLGDEVRHQLAASRRDDRVEVELAASRTAGPRRAGRARPRRARPRSPARAPRRSGPARGRRRTRARRATGTPRRRCGRARRATCRT